MIASSSADLDMVVLKDRVGDVGDKSVVVCGKDVGETRTINFKL
jgi:hypothetical protein